MSDTTSPADTGHQPTDAPPLTPSAGTPAPVPVPAASPPPPSTTPPDPLVTPDPALAEEDHPDRPLLDTDPPAPRFVDQLEVDRREVRRCTAYQLRAFLAPPGRVTVDANPVLRHAVEKVEENKYDTHYWLVILQHLRQAGSTAKPVLLACLEEMLVIFPSLATVVSQLVAEHQVAANWTTVQSLYGQSLLQCLDVELYANYVALVTKQSEGAVPEGQLQVRQAHEFALKQVGHAVTSGPLWEEYIHFLRGLKKGTPEHTAVFSAPAGQEEAAQREAIRSAFHRALLVPQQRLNELWREYERFEPTVSASPEMARKLIEEQQSVVNLCRVVYAERVRIYAHVPPRAGQPPTSTEGNPAALVRFLYGPPSLTHPSLVAHWRDAIRWEMINRQRLEHSDHAARVSYAYEQALMDLRSHPDLWHAYANFHLTPAGLGAPAAQAVLSRGLTACPGAVFLCLAKADLAEASDDPQEAKEILEAVLRDHVPQPVDPLAEEQAAGLARTAALADRVGTFTTEGVGLVFVHLLHLVRRTEGIQAARKFFASRAIKWDGCPWSVFAAAAMMDWHHDQNAKATRNIFDFGAKRGFLVDPGYVKAYTSWLLGQGDDTNARNVLERALESCLPMARARMWDLRLAMEAEMGNWPEVRVLEGRRRTDMASVSHIDPEDDALVCAMIKYRACETWPLSGAERVYVRQTLGYAPRTETEFAEENEAKAGATGGTGGSGAAPVGPSGAGAKRGREEGGGTGGGASGGSGNNRPPPPRMGMPPKRETGYEGWGDILLGPLMSFLKLLPPPKDYHGAVPHPDLVLGAIIESAVEPSWPDGPNPPNAWAGSGGGRSHGGDDLRRSRPRRT